MKLLLLVVGMFLFIPNFMFSQWSDDSSVNLQISNSTGAKSSTKIGACSNGIYYIGYFCLTNGTYTVRLQLIAQDGNLLWGDNGIEVSNHPTMSWVTDWDMSVDSENNAILTWQDIRSNSNTNIVAYKISTQGTFIWGENGILLSDSEDFDAAPKVAVTGSNDVVFAWQSNYVIIMQRISATGTKMWGDWGITLSSANRFTWPQLMAVGNDDIILKYFEDSGQTMYPIRHIKAQRYNTEGNPVWENIAVVSDAGTISSWTQILSFVSDGNEGFYMAWHDNRYSGTIASSWVQHVNSQGITQFPTNGTLLSSNHAANQFEPEVVKIEGSTDISVWWREVNGNQNQYGIYGQVVNSTGECQWGATGKEIIPVASDNVNLEIVFPSANDYLMVYRQGSDDLYMRRLDANGNSLWEEIDKPISNSESGKTSYKFSSFLNNQWITAWVDSRNSESNIYAQNFHPDGSLGNVSSNGFITGQIVVEGNMVSVEEVSIMVGEETFFPDGQGFYSIELEPATYNINVSHSYVVSQEATGIVVNAGETVIGDFSLIMQRRDVTVRVVDQFGDEVSNALVSIDGPEDSYNFVSSESHAVLIDVPYGEYLGSANFSEAVFPTVSADTTINSDNAEILFMFIFGGINEVEGNENILIYPQPISASSILEFNALYSGLYQINFFSVHGKESQKMNEMRFEKGTTYVELSDIIPSNLMSGIYYLTFYNEEKFFWRTIKFIQ